LGFGSRNANMIVANQQAMTAAVALANRIDSGAILQMHQALLASAQPDIAGKWREEQVWIGGTTVSPRGALFVPPHHRHIRAAIDDLLAFVSRTDIPTLAHAALAHAQFETIHPFADGNGRTGRALVHAQLRNARLTRHVTVPVSSGLLANVDAYFEALTDHRNGNPGPIVQRFCEAAFLATANGRRLVADLRTIRSTWETRIRARRDSAAWRVADVLLRQPVVNARFAANELNVAPNNVYRLFEPLLRAEVIVEFSNKRRDQLWSAPEVLAVLDAFALRAGRRRRPSD
ncbi:MAG: Fic family protein, partial [Actinobacteria bacterium]|nr:Fic family protein [Actinomycetota bacterium]